MFFYLFTIIINTAIIIFTNYFFYPPVEKDFSLVIFSLIIVGLVVIEIIIDSIFATVVRWILPEKLFSEDKTFYKATKKEMRFYEKFGIKKWKDKVLELGAVTGFRKNKLQDSSSVTYVKRFIIECNYGIIVHVCCIIFGFTVMLFSLFMPVFWATLHISLVNLFLNILPIFILRYNLPKLHVLYKYNLKKSKSI